jgi:hypothetical protein
MRQLDKEFNDKMVRLHTLLEEYKYLMTNTPCGAMKNFFRGKFFENLKKLEDILQQQDTDSRYSSNHRCDACRVPHCTERQI